MTLWCFGKFRSDGHLRQDSPADGNRDAERPDWQVLVFLNQLVDTEYDGPLRRAGGESLQGPQIHASQRPPKHPTHRCICGRSISGWPCGADSRAWLEQSGSSQWLLHLPLPKGIKKPGLEAMGNPEKYCGESRHCLVCCTYKSKMGHPSSSSTWSGLGPSRNVPPVFPSGCSGYPRFIKLDKWPSLNGLSKTPNLKPC